MTFYIGEIVKFDDEEWLVNGIKRYATKITNMRSGESFWLTNDVLQAENQPVHDEDFTGADGDGRDR